MGGDEIVGEDANRRGRKRVKVKSRAAIVVTVILKLQEVGKEKGKWKSRREVRVRV